MSRHSIEDRAREVQDSGRPGHYVNCKGMAIALPLVLRPQARQ